MNLYVGADWSATHLVCATATDDEDPKPLKKTVRPALDDVIDFIDFLKGRFNAQHVHVLIEAGAPIWVWLLFQAGAIVHVIDPKQAHSYAKSTASSGAKDDKRDALTLADLCSHKRRRKNPFSPDTLTTQKLDLLAAAHETHTKDITRIKQRIRDLLRRLMPLVDRALPKDLMTAWVQAFLRAVPTPRHAKTLTRKDLDRLCKGARTPSKDKLFDALQQTRAPWLDEGLAQLYAQQMHDLLQQLSVHHTQLQRVDAQLDEVSMQMGPRQRAQTMPGVGLMSSVAVLQYAFRNGLVGHRDQASVQMGASPVFIGSGTRKDGKPKGGIVMRRAAAARARRATYLIGRLASQHLVWGEAMYNDARQRGQKAATAYRRIARCVLRILTAMVRRGEDYDEGRYIRALQSHGVSWAMSLSAS